MPETLNSAGLILGRRPYQESSSLITVYTRCCGKLTLIARGARKPHSKLAGHIEPLTLADLMIVKGRSRSYIGSSLTRRAYPNIRGDLNRLYYAGKAVALVKRLVADSEPDEGLFVLLSNWLDCLDEDLLIKSSWPLKSVDSASDLSRDNGEIILAFFIFKFFNILGYSSDWSRCSVCDRKIDAQQVNYFDPAGALVCADCQQKRIAPRNHRPNFYSQEADYKPVLRQLSNNGLKLLKFITDHNWEALKRLRMNRVQAQEIVRLGSDFLRYYF